LVLVGVIWYGIPATPGSAGAGSPETAAPPKEKRPTRVAPRSKLSAVPLVELAQIIAFNPFEKAQEQPSAGSAETTTIAPATLTTTSKPASSQPSPPVSTTFQVQAIYATPSGNVAILNGRIIRPGDQLQDGSRVVSISLDGVRIDRDL
jgi:hypothetical protein